MQDDGLKLITYLAFCQAYFLAVWVWDNWVAGFARIHDPWSGAVSATSWSV